MSTAKAPVIEAPAPPAADPRLLVAATEKINRRLEAVFESARREFNSEPNVEQIVAALEHEAITQGLEARHLAPRAGMAVELLDNVTSALLAAEAQHDQNLACLATHKKAASELQVETNLRDAQAAVAMREWSAPLVNADIALRSYADSIRAMLPALRASVGRRVWACAIASRKLFVASVARDLQRAQMTVNVARSHQQTQPDDERGLLALLDKMRQLTVSDYPVPEILWPGSTSDVFAAPSLA
jgi:hypothetical protein